MSEMTERLAAALRRIDDFNAVQSDSDREEMIAAVLRLQEAVGIDDDSRAVLRDGIEHLNLEKQTAGVLLGLVVGLFAAQAGQ